MGVGAGAIARLPAQSELPAAERAIDELADEWVERWVSWGRASAPADHGLVEDGIRRCYQLSGQPWHGRVVWVDSPFTGVLVGCLLGAPEVAGHVLGAPVSTTSWHTPDWVRDRETVWRVRPDHVRYRMEHELYALVGPNLLHRVEMTVQARVDDQLGLRTDFYEAAEPVGRRRIGPTDPAQVRRALAAASPQLPRRARSKLRKLLAEGGIGAAPRSLDRYPHISGQALAPWLAKATLLQRVCGAREVGSLWERVAAYRDANAAGPWLPSPSHVIVAERPQQVRTEDVVAPGQSHHHRRLHADDGPAVLWRDGTAAYAVHGLRLPFDLIQHGWPVQRILHERNAEIRRIAVERLGWDRFVAKANLALVHGPVPDPGNPGNSLSLYDLPAVYAIGTRLLLCTNASPERDGTIRRFGLHVPATIDDAVAAAAWTFDVDRATYQQIDRAT